MIPDNTIQGRAAAGQALLYGRTRRIRLRRSAHHEKKDLAYTVNYTGSDWVFFNQITVAVGDERYKKTYGYSDVTRDVGWGKVWEYAKKNGKDDMEMLRAIANSSEAIVRFEGNDYYKDLTVTDTDKKALRQAIEVYDAFNN